ncbi:hypothetical protein Prudu_011413 [Prunus dulcis]|uniref:Berberine/berberine-like domain-containing protein n=1 Tax=Prunus dulcis TaxID=3755 RepID=A0A4Y1RAK6_PRUDU|nr:hypothetical protein Prudu_011413 [Prunus dulcis]
MISIMDNFKTVTIDGFLQCLTIHSHAHPIQEAIYTPHNASFQSVLLLHINNRRYSTPTTPKPLAIITAKHESMSKQLLLCNWYKTNVYGFPAGFVQQLVLEATSVVAVMGYDEKYGLSVDNVVDAKIVTVKGQILDRKSMGEDLFWAIRGGGGASFGLVPVPSKVTVFNVTKTIEEGATDLVYKWQTVAPELPEDLFLRAMPQVKNIDTKEKDRGNCHEVRWVEATVFWAENPIGTPIDVLLDKPIEPATFYKGKADYMKEPLPKYVIEALWKKMIEIENIWVDMNPYGGRMSEIPESATPYPHRAGKLFFALYLYDDEPLTKSKTGLPNYRDLDIGANQDNQTSLRVATVYGRKYFKGNFARLVRVKTAVDPHNFFRHKQSIPPF